MFQPINPPPSDHHQFSTGHSTENGDNARTVASKINAGFKHVYETLRGMGATLADEVEYVAKTEFDALVHEMDETKAELANLKMMVQGLGFAGAKITDPSHSMSFSPAPTAMVTEPVVTIKEATNSTGLSWSGLIGADESAEPVVTVKEVTEQ